MNCLIFRPEERSGEIVRLAGARARYVFDFHDLKPGIEITVGEVSGRLGRGTVERVSSDETVLRVALDRDSPKEPYSAVIAAIPRPQTVKKVIQYSAMLGVSELHLVRAEHTVPSYLSSKSLEPEAIERETVKGLEQAVATDAPSIKIWRSFREFAGGELQQIGSRAMTKLIADPGGTRMNSIAASDPFVWAIGPERGWTDGELDQFLEANFERLGLGPRMLRVEVALTAVWAAIRCGGKG